METNVPYAIPCLICKRVRLELRNVIRNKSRRFILQIRCLSCGYEDDVFLTPKKFEDYDANEKALKNFKEKNETKEITTPA